MIPQVARLWSTKQNALGSSRCCANTPSSSSQLWSHTISVVRCRYSQADPLTPLNTSGTFDTTHRYAKDCGVYNDHAATVGDYSQECARYVQRPSGDDRPEPTCSRALQVQASSLCANLRVLCNVVYDQRFDRQNPVCIIC